MRREWKAMDPFLEYKLGNISFNDLYRGTVQSELERILEDPLSNMKNYRFSRRSSHDQSKGNLLNIGVNCLDIDNTGQVLLGGGDDGSLSIWGLDEALHQNDEDEQELINKRLNFIKRQPNQADNEPAQSLSYKNKVSQTNSSNAMRLVHSFQTRRNKYRMYRQSNAMISSPRSHISNEANFGRGGSGCLLYTSRCV